MTVTTTDKGLRRNQGYVKVIEIEDGDTVIIAFKGSPTAFSHDGQFPSVRWPFDWMCQVETSASIACSFAVNPDYNNDTDGDWIDHATHATITRDTGYQEQMAVSALRFVASTAGAKLTVSGPFPVDVVEP